MLSRVPRPSVFLLAFFASLCIIKERERESKDLLDMIYSITSQHSVHKWHERGWYCHGGEKHQLSLLPSTLILAVLHLICTGYCQHGCRYFA